MESVYKIISLPSVQKTADRIESLKEPYPSFVHKWTRTHRAYLKSELSVPEEVFLSGREINSPNSIIGIGGTRAPTVETFCLVSRVAYLLAQRGFVIVSGGVPGVDFAAHMGVIDAQRGQTYAVMANPARLGLSGHEWPSPSISASLRKRGGFISEYKDISKIGSEEYRERLLQRDRIISGISNLFIAFECNVNSATIDTLYRSLHQGKRTLAILPSAPSHRQGIQSLYNDPRIMVIDSKSLSDNHIVDIIAEQASQT